MKLRGILLAAVSVGAFAAMHPASGAAQERRQVGQLITEGVPPTPPAVAEKVDQYNGIRSADFHGFLENGGVLIKTNFGETAQLHEVKAPLGARTQLTFYSDPIYQYAGVRPNGSGAVYFEKDEGGNELFRGYLLDRATAKITPFTEPGARAEKIIFDRDGRRAAWAVTRSGKFERDIVVGDPSNPSDRTVIVTAPGEYFPLAFSSDGSKLLYAQYVSIEDSRRYVFDFKTGKSRQLNPDAHNVYYGYDQNGAFSNDGQSVYILSDEGSDFARIVQLDLATGAKTTITPATPWDIEDNFKISRDGRTLAYLVNEDGASHLHLMDLTTRRQLPVPTLPSGVIDRLQFDHDGARLGFSLTSIAIPGDVWVYDLRQRKLTRWTDSETGGITASSFVSPTVVHIPSFDGSKVPAFLLMPRTPGPHPVVVQIHGGPEAQARDAFSNPRFQYWVNELGAAVLMPNIRGSGGYGRAYRAGDNGFKRQDAIKDIGAVLDWIGTQPSMDKTKVVVHGGSWGGYAVLSSLANYPNQLAGGIDIVGSSNLVSFLERTDTYRRDLRRVEYGDERIPEMRAYLTKIAPLTNAKNIKGPVLVVQGKNDPRVKPAEAEQILAAVRANGREAWYMLALDEGHGFYKASNEKALMAAEDSFLRRAFEAPQPAGK